MTSPLGFYWNRCVDYHRELKRMPELLRNAIVENAVHIEFEECKQALRVLHDEVTALMPAIDASKYRHLKDLLEEATERYNSSLDILRSALAREVELVKFNEYHQVQLCEWTEQIFLDFVASLIVENGNSKVRDDVIRSTESILELKPNIGGVGVNINALIRWVRSRL